MNPDLIIPFSRFAILILLYIFLALVAWVILRDLRASAAPSKKTVLGCLVVLEGGDASLMPGELIEIEAQNSVGRARENSIFIDDATVSARHALISYRHNRWWLRDLGSTNGTFVNNKPIQGVTEIFNGDVIAIGQVWLRLQSQAN
jgi:hypothetical protein